MSRGNRVLRQDFKLHTSTRADPPFTAEYAFYGRIMVGKDPKDSAKMRIGYEHNRVYSLKDQTIDQLLAELLAARKQRQKSKKKKRHPPGMALRTFAGQKQKKTVLPAVSPLDFGVKRNSYVILELSERLKNWKFREANSVTAKRDLRKQYFDLAPFPDVDSRSLMYFGARMRKTALKTPLGDQLNVHAVFEEGRGKSIEVIFDPGVQNPGDPPPNV